MTLERVAGQGGWTGCAATWQGMHYVLHFRQDRDTPETDILKTCQATPDEVSEATRIGRRCRASARGEDGAVAMAQESRTRAFEAVLPVTRIARQGRVHGNSVIGCPELNTHLRQWKG